MFYAVEILSHKKPLGVPWICGVYDARSKLPVGAVVPCIFVCWSSRLTHEE